jgi:nucleoside 2-deoxyribosyltransferase
MQIYLAAPLFNGRERAFNEHLRDRLIINFNVFLPQEDGLLLEELVRNGMDNDVAEKTVYNADVSAMKDSDIIVAVLDGANIDEGVAFELGYGSAVGKICVGLQTDTRRQLPTGNNPMIAQSCLKIFNSIDILCNWLLAKYGTLGHLKGCFTRTQSNSPIN